MSDIDMVLVRQLIPNYDDLPNILSPADAGPIIGMKEHTLAVNRCNQRHAIGYVRSGRKIFYPKAELAKFLIRNAVGCGTSV